MSRQQMVLGIKYGENDTRGFGGVFSCFVTEKGKTIWIL